MTILIMTINIKLLIIKAIYLTNSRAKLMVDKVSYIIILVIMEKIFKNSNKKSFHNSFYNMNRFIKNLMNKNKNH